jgi:hypothetical protein
MHEHENRKKKKAKPTPPTNGQPPLLVSMEDARYYLGGICLKTVENLVKAHKLPTISVRRRKMIPFHALQKFAKPDRSTKPEEPR